MGTLPAVLLRRAIDEDKNYYNYNPILWGAILFLILFLLVSLAITFLSWKHRVAYTTILLIGTYGEVIGYGARIKGSIDPTAFTPFLVMSVFIILSPVAFAAANYIIFGRLLRIVTGLSSNEKPVKLSYLPVNRITTIFVTSDIISFLVQAAGAGLLLTRTPDGLPNTKLRRIGEQTLIGGLCINLISFCFFATVIVYFSFGLRRLLKLGFKCDFVPPSNRSATIVPIIAALYFSVILIIGRSAYRIVEFNGGWNTAVNSTEAYFYCFDATLMILATGIYVFVFPYKYGVYGKKKTEEYIRQARPVNLETIVE